MITTTDATKYLKSLSMPKLDDVLAYSGLQRAPSTFSKVMGGIGLVSFGALLGAGVSLFFSTPKNRKAVSTALTNGIDKVSEFVTTGVETLSGQASNVTSQVSNGAASGKQAVKTALR